MARANNARQGIISLVAGTRPEVIKLAPVYGALRQEYPQWKVEWLSTGQHQEMLEQAQEVFSIIPDEDFGLMRPDQSPLDIVLAAAEALHKRWRNQPPQLVVVQGDTATAYAAALAAFYQRIPIAHVEAGLRSHRLYEPFPEESQRRMIAAMTQLHFAPTHIAADNLLQEGVDASAVYTVGNTVVDALNIITATKGRTDFLKVSPDSRVMLVTAHRRENHGPRLEHICEAIADIHQAVEDIEIVFPVHLNPQVQKTVRGLLSGQARIHLLPPCDYFQFVKWMRRSTLILTDSGGVQEEAPSFDIPVLVLREQTERPEAVQAGMAKLVGSDRLRIAREAIRLLTDKDAYKDMQRSQSPFGDGKSGTRIASIIADFLRESVAA